MRIKKIISRSRRDFFALYECETCQDEHKMSGYDDTYFHNSVIPDLKCKECGSKAPKNYKPLSPLYPEDMEI